jgi:hypothetical protein
MVGCNGPDPIDPKNTYSVENQTEQDVNVVYTITKDHIFWELPRRNYTDSCVAFTEATTQLPLDKYGFYVSSTPSEMFEKVVFLSISGDTLRVLYPIDDSLWVDSISIVDYGYKVRNYHWLYKLNK